MNFLHKHKRLFLATGITLCIVAIIVTITGVAPSSVLGRTFSYVVVPLQRGASSATQWVGGRIDVLMRSAEILAENQRLQDENARLRAENDVIDPMRDELYHFYNMFDMSERYPELEMVGARMIGQNPNDWQSSFLINRGLNQGIQENMIVLGEYGGVLGVIHQVGPNHAQVITIRDTRFGAAATNTRTEDVGAVRGDMVLGQDGYMRMLYIPATARFMPGDIIRTSPHGAFFPPGLTLGTVVSVHPDPGGLTQHAIIRSEANPDRVDFVLVVMDLFGDAHDFDETEDVTP